MVFFFEDVAEGKFRLGGYAGVRSGMALLEVIDDLIRQAEAVIAERNSSCTGPREQTLREQPAGQSKHRTCGECCLLPEMTAPAEHEHITFPRSLIAALETAKRTEAVLHDDHRPSGSSQRLLCEGDQRQQKNPSGAGWPATKGPRPR